MTDILHKNNFALIDEISEIIEKRLIGAMPIQRGQFHGLAQEIILIIESKTNTNKL